MVLGADVHHTVGHRSGRKGAVFGPVPAVASVSGTPADPYFVAHVRHEVEDRLVAQLLHCGPLWTGLEAPVPMVLMLLYSIRSEGQFCERLRYDLLFKY